VSVWGHSGPLRCRWQSGACGDAGMVVGVKSPSLQSITSTAMTRRLALSWASIAASDERRPLVNLSHARLPRLSDVRRPRLGRQLKADQPLRPPLRPAAGDQCSSRSVPRFHHRRGGGKCAGITLFKTRESRKATRPVRAQVVSTASPAGLVWQYAMTAGDCCIGPNRVRISPTYSAKIRPLARRKASIAG